MYEVISQKTYYAMRSQCPQCMLTARSDLRLAAVRAAFGDSDPDSFWDPDNGYDGEEWLFWNGNAEHPIVFCLYPRFGQFRIGGDPGLDPAELNAFGAWLTAKLAS